MGTHGLGSGAINRPRKKTLEDVQSKGLSNYVGLKIFVRNSYGGVEQRVVLELDQDGRPQRANGFIPSVFYRDWIVDSSGQFHDVAEDLEFAILLDAPGARSDAELLSFLLAHPGQWMPARDLQEPPGHRIERRYGSMRLVRASTTV